LRRLIWAALIHADYDPRRRQKCLNYLKVSIAFTSQRVIPAPTAALSGWLLCFVIF